MIHLVRYSNLSPGGGGGGGKPGSKGRMGVLDFARDVRDRLIWTMHEWTLADPEKPYKKVDLSELQAYILFVVGDAEPIAIGEVAKRLHQEKSVITKSLTRLIERVLVRKEIDTSDHRRYLLSLTRKGRTAFNKLDRLSVESYARWLKHVPRSEWKMVLMAIEVLDVAMEEMRIERATCE